MTAPTSTTPPLSIEARADWLTGYLRVDQIRTDTLTQLVQGWADPDVRDDVIEALDRLAGVVHGVRREGELDAAVEEVEASASMDTARVEFTAGTGRRLMQELAGVVQKLCRFNPLANPAPELERRRTA
ncbi:hypothetical protein G3I51_13420 [Streptomyces sp. SID9944]|nr:hypothetical protein [Streptomyces sp. SID9944]